jgi:hypothetical protein
MTDSSVAVTAAIIAACAALASAGVSALTSWSMSRRSGVQKIAEFRKEWIENLRVNFAEFHSTCSLLTLVIKQYKAAKDFAAQERLGEEMKARYERLNYLHNYIVLMLNPSEELHQQMENRLKVMFTSLFPTVEHPEDATAVPSPLELRSFTDLARKILKAEWNRLKSET